MDMFVTLRLFQVDNSPEAVITDMCDCSPYFFYIHVYLIIDNKQTFSEN